MPKSLSLVTSFRCHLGIVRSVGDTIYVGFEGPFGWPERLDYIDPASGKKLICSPSFTLAARTQDELDRGRNRPDRKNEKAGNATGKWASGIV